MGLSVLLLGWAIWLGTLSPFVVPPLFVILLMTQVQILPEERALRERFGDDYDRYCQQVGRWLGRGQQA